MMAHGSHPPSSTLGGKCPFRASLQAQSLRTSAAETTAGAMSNKVAAREEEEVEEVEEEGGKRKEACECVASGLQPRGECCVRSAS